MTASITFGGASLVAGTAYLNRPPRELVHCMPAPRFVPGDKVACPIEGVRRRPLPAQDPFRRGCILAALNGHALVKLGDAYEWLPHSQLLRLQA